MSRKKFIFSVRVFFPAIMTNKKPFEGKAAAVSTQNKLGKFDVLPQHINFITLIFKELTILTTEDEEIRYQFEKGILAVKRNQVNIFLGV